MSGEVVLGAATHTVAHHLREIDSAIRKVLEPMVERRRRVEIEAMRKGRQEAWIGEMVDVFGLALRHRRISLLHLRGVPWARIGEFVGQRSLSVTADTYTHVLTDERELEHAKLLT
jgi:integrase